MTSFEEFEQSFTHLLAQEEEPAVEYGACESCPRLQQALGAIANNRAFYDKTVRTFEAKSDEAEDAPRERSVRDYLGYMANLTRFERSIEGRRADIERLREDCEGVEGTPVVRTERDGSQTEITTLVCGSPSLPETDGELPYQEPVTVIRRKW